MSIPLKKFSPYFLENISSGAVNQLQISSTCNADCIFCSNKQNPFKIERYGFRSIDEIEQVLWAMEDSYDSIILNESLPGRISEGEALLHPKLFDILKLIRNKFTNNILDITTNGSLLSPSFIEALSKFLPMEIVLSIPSANKEYWTESFSLKEEQYENAINSIPLLVEKGFTVLPTIVPMPSWVGYADVENTISYLSKNGIKEILIYAPGYTKYTTDSVIQKLIFDKEELSKFLTYCEEKYNVNFIWSLDPKKDLSLDIDSITYCLNNKMAFKKIALFTSSSAYEKMLKIAPIIESELDIGKIEVVCVKNESYGGNIECAGLWLIKDIENIIDELCLKNTDIVLPNNFLDKYGFDLIGENILNCSNHYSNNLILLSREEYSK